jgi:hypothetical protein
MDLSDNLLLKNWGVLADFDLKESGFRSHPIKIYDDFRISIGMIYPGCHQSLIFEFIESKVDFSFPSLELAGLMFYKAAALKSADYNQVFVLRKNEDQDVNIFNTICMDIISYSESNKYMSSCIFYNSLKKRLFVWIDFLKDEKEKNLSVRQQVGLIGELVQLSLLKEYIEDEKIWINIWCGPDKNSKDFVTLDRAIEVKSMLGDDQLVTISSLDQLDSHGLLLYLSVFSFRESDVDGLSLNGYVNLILSMIECEQVLKVFMKKLSQVGYSLLSSKHYTLNFIRGDNITYEITKYFPKLITGEVDRNISEVKYKLHLTDLFEFSVDTKEMYKGL